MLSWGRGRKEDVNELVARRNFPRAIELLKKQLQSDSKNINVRQQLADVLILAGQKTQAVPILHRLADDFAAEGLAAKAIAVLKKIERLEPGGSEVDRKLAAIIHKKRVEEQSRNEQRAFFAQRKVDMEARVRAASGSFRVTETGLTPLEAEPDREEETDPIEIEVEEIDDITAGDFSVDDVPVADAEVEVVPDPEVLAAQRSLTTPLFESLSHEQLVSLIDVLELFTFGPGDIIVSEGEPRESLFIVTHGSVKMFVKNKAGRQIRVGELREGDFFGEEALLSGHGHRLTATAASACELLELDKEMIEQLSETDPFVRDALYAYFTIRTNQADLAAGQRE